MEIVDVNFKVTSEGVHLLRNKFSYQILPFNKIKNAYLVRGKSVKNWIVILSFGLLFLTLSAILLYYLINSLSVDDKPVRFYNMFGNGLIGVIILGVLGIISIFNAVKTIPMIVIVLSKRKIELRVLKNRKNLDDLLHFFNSHGIEVERKGF
ncbi:hypothetical protein [Cyclobacterium roseum]|uniref:hypothetical protein n=1 Tax=Cyclobacterium roseum TaxID=2666137 RepID=UPI001391C5C9|nr:hypothetical protein [Cyclobacterium roseum]